MNKKTFLAALIISAMLVSLAAGIHVNLAKAQSPKTIVVPDDYPTIQAAIDNASVGDTVFVKNGVYDGAINATLTINKSISVFGENPDNTVIRVHPRQVQQTIVEAGQYIGTIWVYVSGVDIEADNVTLSGFTIDCVSDITAQGNQLQISNNKLELRDQTSLMITGNKSLISNNSFGETLSEIQLEGFNNTAINNTGAGWNVRGNFNYLAKNNGTWLQLIGSKNVITQNLLTYRGLMSGFGFYLTKGDSNVVCDNTLTGNSVGIQIGDGNNAGGSYNIFSGNRIEAPSLGIVLGNGSYNVFYGNLVTNCGRKETFPSFFTGPRYASFGGLALGGGVGQYLSEPHSGLVSNLFFGNIFLNNTLNFVQRGIAVGPNSFDNGVEGNYWDDYLTKYPDAVELDHSGVGSIPYQIYGNVSDKRPLMNAPDVSSVIPTLPQPWASLLSTSLICELSTVSSPTPSASVPEFPTWTALPLALATTLLAVITVKSRKIRKERFSSSASAVKTAAPKSLTSVG